MIFNFPMQFLDERSWAALYTASEKKLRGDKNPVLSALWRALEGEGDRRYRKRPSPTQIDLAFERATPEELVSAVNAIAELAKECLAIGRFRAVAFLTELVEAIHTAAVGAPTAEEKTRIN